MGETSEWCNSFVLAPKANGKVPLYLDPVRLNKVLIRPVNPEWRQDVSLGYQSQKLDEQYLYLTFFSCPFARYKYILLPFGVVPVGDMF